MNDKSFDLLSVHFVEKPVFEGYHGDKYGFVLARRWNNEVVTFFDIDWKSVSVWHLLCIRWGAEVEGKHTFVIGITPWFEAGFYDSDLWVSIGDRYFSDGKWNSNDDWVAD